MIKPERIELEGIYSDLAITKGALDAARQSNDMGKIPSCEEQVEKYETQLRDALAWYESEEGKQETLEQRVEEEVRDNGYVLDTMEVDGLTAPEIITDDAQYNLIRKGIQILVVGMNTSHLKLINALKGEHLQEVEALKEFVQGEITTSEQLRSDNKDLELANYQMGLENDELSEKVTKIAALQYEADQQIAQQKKHIEDLQNQIAIGVRGALNVVDIPQDTSKLAAEIIANKPRITNVQFKDKHGIDRRTKTAIEVLTGDPIEYQEYVEKRYIILNEVESEQYRADEANKKAEAEQVALSIPETKEPEIQPVNAVLEEEATTGEQTFPESDQVDATEPRLADQSQTEDGEGAKESQVITLESLDARLKALELKVAA